MDITAIAAISMSYSQVAPIQSFFHSTYDNDEYGDDIEYEQSGDEVEMGMGMEIEEDDDDYNRINRIESTETTSHSQPLSVSSGNTSTPMVFVAYSDGSIQIIDLNSLTEICTYSNIDRDYPVLFPKDKAQRGMNTSRGSDVRVRSLMVAGVGMANERAMQEYVMIVCTMIVVVICFLDLCI